MSIRIIVHRFVTMFLVLWVAVGVGSCSRCGSRKTETPKEPPSAQPESTPPRSAPSSRFSQSHSWVAEEDTGSISVADVNRDGHLDLLIGHRRFDRTGRNDGTLEVDLVSGVTVHLNNGKGQFTYVQMIQTYPIGSSEIPGRTRLDLTTGDFNFDGNLDFVATDAVSDTLTFWLGEGNGNFSRGEALAVGKRPNAVTVQLDSKEKRHWVLSVSHATNSMTMHEVSREAKSVGHYSVRKIEDPDRVACGDFNGDSLMDCAVTSDDANVVSVLIQKEPGIFLRETFEPGPGPYSIRVLDANRDGYEDLLVGFAGILYGGKYGFGILYGNGKGQFTVGHVNLDFGHPVEAVDAGEISKGTRLDIVVGGSGGWKLYSYVESKDAYVEVPKAATGESAPGYDLKLVDINHDQVLDLLSVGRKNERVFLSLGQPSQ